MIYCIIYNLNEFDKEKDSFNTLFPEIDTLMLEINQGEIDRESQKYQRFLDYLSKLPEQFTEMKISGDFFDETIFNEIRMRLPPKIKFDVDQHKKENDAIREKFLKDLKDFQDIMIPDEFDILKEFEEKLEQLETDFNGKQIGFKQLQLNFDNIKQEFNQRGGVDYAKEHKQEIELNKRINKPNKDSSDYKELNKELFELADKSRLGDDDTKKNKKFILEKFFIKHPDKMNKDTAYSLANFYKKNKDQYKKYILLAADAGHPNALYACAQHYNEGTGGFEKSPNLANKFMYEVLQKGDKATKVAAQKYLEEHPIDNPKHVRFVEELKEITDNYSNKSSNNEDVQEITEQLSTILNGPKLAQEKIDQYFEYLGHNASAEPDKKNIDIINEDKSVSAKQFIAGIVIIALSVFPLFTIPSLAIQGFVYAATGKHVGQLFEPKNDHVAEFRDKIQQLRSDDTSSDNLENNPQNKP